MCAAVQIKEFYPFEQKYEKGILSYRVMSGQNAYYLDRDTISDEGLVTASMPPAGSFVLQCEFRNSQQDAVDIPAVFQRLKDALSSIFLDEQGFDKTLTATFVLSTYVYQAFNGLPNLWFYLPRIYQRQIAERLIRELCFNGIVVTNNYTSEAATACIKRLHPTLIFQQYSRSKSNKLEQLYATPNTREHFLPTKDLEIVQLFCPKIILSSLLPLPHYLNHSIPIIVNKAPQSPVIGCDFASIRADLALTALLIQTELYGILNSMQFSKDDLFSPITAMATTLQALKVITADELGSFIKALTEKQRTRDRNDQLNYVNDVLFGISEYLGQLNPQLASDFIALSDMVNFLHEIETVGLDMNARLLSRFLNRFQLIEGRPTRRRVQTGTSYPQTYTQGAHALYTQKTFVKIDRSRLKQLIYSDLIYKQQ